MLTNSAVNSRVATLRILPAPQGWCACVLDANFPIDEHGVRETYRLAVEDLLESVPTFTSPSAQEVLLQFDRMRPEAEISVLQRHARNWLPDIGLGVWSNRPAPALWTQEEFEGAAPGTLRPFMYRVMRVHADPKIVQDAWDKLLGTGVLIRIAVADSIKFYKEAFDYYQPQMTEVSLTSFPFYVPLLEASAISEATEQMLECWLAGADVYIRESMEDGGLLLCTRMNVDILAENLTQRGKQSGLRWQIT